MNSFQPFVMEEMMSRFEQTVDFNLSESGVHPMHLNELLGDDPGAIQALLESDLNYPEVNGSQALRETIAGLYSGGPGGGPGADNVLVTVGAIEANFLAVTSLLAPGDEIVVMLPNYMQVWGVAKNHGLAVKSFNLIEDQGWAPDLDELAATVTPATKMIAVCNPNNPTGRILRETEMDAIIAQAARVGAWILADEVYAGAERESDVETPSFYGRYDKVIANGSLSKAYGLPGLRIGWSVAPQEAIEACWRRHEYLTISGTRLSNRLAEIALSPAVRPRILARTRGYIRRGYPILEEWMAQQGNTFSLSPPGAAAIAFVRYNLDINSTELADRLREERSVLTVPGDHFGLDHHLRISYGLPEDYLREGLGRLRALLLELGA